MREQKSKLLILSTFIIFSIFLTGCGGTIQSGGRTKNFVGIPTPFKRIVLPSSPYGPEGKAPPIKKNFTPEERCHNNLKNIGFALELYAVNHQGKYPSSLSQLDKEILKSIPTEPVTGKSYLYLPNSDLTNYELKCPSPETHNLCKLKYNPKDGIIK